MRLLGLPELILIVVALLVLAGLIAVIWLVIWAVTRTTPRTAGDRNDRALEILRERYARGEITGDEYAEMWRQLTSPDRRE